MPVLHLAAQKGHISIVKYLLDCKAKIDARNAQDETVFDIAMRLEDKWEKNETNDENIISIIGRKERKLFGFCWRIPNGAIWWDRLTELLSAGIPSLETLHSDSSSRTSLNSLISFWTNALRKAFCLSKWNEFLFYCLQCLSSQRKHFAFLKLFFNIFLFSETEKLHF